MGAVAVYYKSHNPFTMTISVKNQIVLAGIAVLAVALATFTWVSAATFPRQSDQPTSIASSTTYAVAQSSIAIVATSTYANSTGTSPVTTGRTAVSVQTVNCGAGAAVYLSFNDVPAAATTGYLLAASSTVTFGDGVPMVYGTIRAFSVFANCSLLVTEFRSPS